MKNIIRKLIREVIDSIFETRSGTAYEKHFNDRVFDRLESEYTNFTNESSSIKQSVFDSIDFLKKLNFPRQDNIGILILKGPKKYVYHKIVDGKIEHSEGNYVWVIVRGNDLETVVFGSSDYIPKNVQIKFTIDKIRDYVINEKGGDFNLTEKDLNKMQLKKVVQKQVDKPKENIVTIDGVKWIVDDKEEKIYKKNNKDVVFNVYDFIDKVDEKTQEEILSFF